MFEDKLYAVQNDEGEYTNGWENGKHRNNKK